MSVEILPTAAKLYDIIIIIIIIISSSSIIIITIEINR